MSLTVIGIFGTVTFLKFGSLLSKVFPIITRCSPQVTKQMKKLKQSYGAHIPSSNAGRVTILQLF